MVDWEEDSFWHGVMRDYTVMPGGTAAGRNLGDMGVHEVGHYLGLYHTWESRVGLCSGNTPGTCENAGDMVCDTPQHREASVTCVIEQQSTCAPPNNPNYPGAPIRNYMNYTPDACMDRFTDGQVERFEAISGQYRPSLGGTPSFNQVSTGVTMTPEPGETFRYDAGESLTVAGHLTATGTTFTASDATAGWRGIRVIGGTTTLDGATVNGVSYAGLYFKRAVSAVEVRGGASLTLRNSVVEGAVNAQGVEAIGAGSAVVIEGPNTLIQNNEQAGVAATFGATVTVRDAAQVLGNGLGVIASGSKTVVLLDGARILINTGPGVLAVESGEVRATPTTGAGEAQTQITENEGGLGAETDGGVQMGSCSSKTNLCTNGGHVIALNSPAGAYFDASATSGGSVRAQGNDWGVLDVACLDIERGAASLPLVIAPILPSGTGCSPAPRAGRSDTDGRFADQAGDDIPAAQRISDGVLALVVDAEDAFASGDEAGAFASLTQAFAAAETPDDLEGVTGVAVRLLARAQPPAVLASLAARATGAARPWALRALAVGEASAGRGAAADAHAAALVAELAGGEHAVFGLGVRVRLAAEAADSASALVHLGALWALAPESRAFASAVSGVAAAFPGADLDEMLGDALAAKAGGADAVPEARAVRVWPNPAGASARVAVALAEPATLDVAVYDALGRRVLVVAEGVAAPAGLYEAALPTAGLPAGTYLVRIVRRTAGGPAVVAVERLAVVR